MKLISGDAGKFNTKVMSKDETGIKRFSIRTNIELSNIVQGILDM